MIYDSIVANKGALPPERLRFKGWERIKTVEKNTPLFAIWSPEGKNAPFLCIEPWFGRSDKTDFAGDISQREYTQTLKADETFEAGYSMIFHQV